QPFAYCSTRLSTGRLSRGSQAIKAFRNLGLNGGRARLRPSRGTWRRPEFEDEGRLLHRPGTSISTDGTDGTSSSLIKRRASKKSTPITARKNSAISSFIGLISRVLVPSDHEPGEHLANAIPYSRIDLDVERHTDQQHQKTCFELFHREQTISSIRNAKKDVVRITC